jgi:hypothetical protein
LTYSDWRVPIKYIDIDAGSGTGTTHDLAFRYLVGLGPG